MNTLEAALAWYDGGVCVIPPAEDGTKKPAWDWKRFQVERPTRAKTQMWFEAIPREGVGILCGQVSGNLEMLELEGCATTSEDFDKIIAACIANDICWLWDLLLQDGYTEWTPSGGLHFLYRVDGNPVPGNHKVAMRPRTPEELEANPQNKGNVTLAETRGEGGFVIVAPSAGRVHPSGQSWDLAAGQAGKVPAITQENRDKLHAAIRCALDTVPAVQPYQPQARPPLSSLGSTIRPGDDFAARTDWADILEPEGFRLTKQHGLYREWERPGKNQGSCSVTTGKTAEDRLYAFSSNTPFFEPNQVYNKFAAYVLINFGPLSETTINSATKDLAQRGYGTPLERSSAAAARVLLDSIETGRNPASDLGTQGQAVSDTAAMHPSAPVELDSLGLPRYLDDIFSGMDWDGPGAAQVFVKAHKGTFSYVADQAEWRKWQGDAWGKDKTLQHENAAVRMAERLRNYAKRVSGEDAELGKNLQRSAKSLCTAQGIKGILTIARSNHHMVTCDEQFDKNPGLLTLRNGTLNLSTLALQPHSPADMLTRRINAAWDPGTAPGRWAQFMEQVMPDETVRAYLQRACGYMLTGSLDERVMFLVHGESGTGKTQFLEALAGVLGDFAGVAPASAFQPRQHGYKGPSEDLHKLKGKRFVMQSELDAGSKLNESLVKSIVGGDTQTTRAVYGQPVDWQPEYTVFMATNYLPRISSSDNAIWNRVKPVKFEQVFIDASGQALDPAARNLGRRMAKENADEIFAWLIEGLKMYQQEGLNEPAAVRDWLNAYRDDVDVVRQFLTEAPDEDRIAFGEDKQITVRDLHVRFVAWSQDNNSMPLGMKNFTERMLSAGWKKEKREKGVMWQGIGPAGWVAQAQTSVMPRGFHPRQ